MKNERHIIESSSANELPMGKSISAVLFDLDGVLIDSGDCIFKSMNRTLTVFGFRKKTRKEVFRHSGLQMSDWITNLLPRKERGNMPLIKAMTKKYISLEMTGGIRLLKLFPGARTTLHHLHETKKIAAVTNASRQGAMVMLKSFGIPEFFDVLVTADDVRRAKPHPEPLLKALKMSGVAAANSLYVGDTEIDLRAGRGARVRTILFQNEFNKKLKAPERITRLSELRALLR